MQQRSDRTLGRRISDWWLNWRSGRKNLMELHGVDREELKGIAADLNMTVTELSAVVRQGTGSADLLYRRMEALGLDAKEVSARAAAVMRDLQRNCATCGIKGRCERDLNRNGKGDEWLDYCVNVDTLEALIQMANARSTYPLTRSQWPSAGPDRGH